MCSSVSAPAYESTSRRWSVVGKELLVGVGNGLPIGLTIATVAFFLPGGGLTLAAVVLLVAHAE